MRFNTERDKISFDCDGFRITGLANKRYTIVVPVKSKLILALGFFVCLKLDQLSQKVYHEFLPYVSTKSMSRTNSSLGILVEFTCCRPLDSVPFTIAMARSSVARPTGHWELWRCVCFSRNLLLWESFHCLKRNEEAAEGSAVAII